MTESKTRRLRCACIGERWFVWSTKGVGLYTQRLKFYTDKKLEILDFCLSYTFWIRPHDEWVRLMCDSWRSGGVTLILTLFILVEQIALKTWRSCLMCNGWRQETRFLSFACIGERWFVWSTKGVGLHAQRLKWLGCLLLFILIEQITLKTWRSCLMCNDWKFER